MGLHIFTNETSHTDVEALLNTGEVAIYPLGQNFYSKAQGQTEVLLGITASQAAALANAVQNGDNVSVLTNDANYQSDAQVSAAITAAINAVLDGAPAALDTLEEIANALGDDANFAGSIAAQQTVQDNRLTSLETHPPLNNNPHAVTKTQVGLGNADNTSDANKPVSGPQQAALDLKYNASNPDGYETPVQLTARDTANRNRANHSGAQLASTISNFATTVRNTILTGLATPVSAVILATDSFLVALGKIQSQLTRLFDFTVQTINQPGHGFTITNGVPLPAYSAPGGIALAQSDNANTLTAFFIIEIIDVDNFVIAVGTRRINATGHGLTVGQYYFLSETTPGQIVLTLGDRAIKDVCLYVVDANTLIIKDNRPFDEDTFLNYACKVTNTDLATNINNATPTSVPLNGATSFNDSTDFYTPEGNGIRVLEAMAAKIRGHVHYTSTGQRVALEARIYVNGSPVGNTTATGYIRSTNGHNRASCTVIDTIVLAPNDLVEIFAIRSTTLTTSSTLAQLGTSSLYIERK